MAFSAFDALRQCQDETDRQSDDAAVLALCASPAVVEIWHRPDVISTVENFADARDNELAEINRMAAYLTASAEEDYRNRLARIESERAAATARAHDTFESRQRGFIQHHAWRAVKGYAPKVCNLFRVNAGKSRLGLASAIMARPTAQVSA